MTDGVTGGWIERTVAILSGGLDSTTLAYWLQAQGHEVHLLSFDYGQRHRRELAYAKATAERLRVPWDLVDLGTIRPLLEGSALTDGGVDVPEGHYAEDTMKATVVPNRNMILLAIAAAKAISWGARYVAFGAHAGDRAVYPDCRAVFVDVLDSALWIGNEGFIRKDFTILAPFLEWTKTEIAEEAGRLGVPLDLTWSCYVGGALHCGRCGTCCERREAIEEAGLDDLTVYEDRDYWRTVKDPR